LGTPLLRGYAAAAIYAAQDKLVALGNG